MMVEKLLEQGLKSLAMDNLYEPSLKYLLLLNKWNVAYNLTAIRDLDSMVSKHLLDSLAILPWIKGNRILDVGSGAGLPGIPLAISKPEAFIVLLDSNGKKIRFLQEVKRQLGLKNLEIVQSRVEDYCPEQGFDTIVSRAFSQIEQMMQWTQRLIAKDGRWLAMKGRYPDAELRAVSQPYRVESYQVEGVDGERCCVLVENTKANNLG